MKLLTVIGTRPQFVKYAPLARGLRAAFTEVLVDTGQHYDHALAQGIFDGFGIPAPEYSLGAVASNPSVLIADVLGKLDGIMAREKPGALLCFGDTNSTLAAALAAVKREVPVLHVEAGERNFTPAGGRVPPWTIPEEANRVMVDQVSSLLLCASRRAVASLAEEKVSGRVVYTGDITYDLYLSRRDEVLAGPGGAERLAALGVQPRGYYFCTVHRALNTDSAERLGGIVEALGALDAPVVLPLHPRTRKMLHQFGLFERLAEAPHVRLLEPVGYDESILLSCHSRAVVTDSGGVVREAFFNGVPSVCLDSTTEWFDLVATGWSVIAGADPGPIVSAARRPPPAERPELFGDGRAVSRTLEALKECLS